jgi:hypothetical protein
MKTAVTFIGMLFLAGTAFADPYVMAKQQAQRTSDENTAEQQRLQRQMAAPSANPTPNAPPMDPALAAAWQNVANLRADVAAFNSATNAPPDSAQKISLLNHLAAAAQGTKPPLADIKKLAAHLLTATAGKQIPAAQQTMLAREVHAAFNGSHLTDAQLQPLLDDTQKILTNAGASPDDAANVIADLKAIAAETK